MINIAQQTLATIVTNNHNAVPVLEKHHLDFCCKGKRTLEEACREKGLSVTAISDELEITRATPPRNKMPFNEMTAEQLISYILIHHHFYVKQSMPTILAHIEKVATKHGERFPYMIEVLYLFKAIQEEMTTHMQKEEMILFPRIKEVAASTAHMNLSEVYIAGPVKVMEEEHDHAGEILYKIRTLTDNYTPPAEACTTFQVCLAELKAFEEDLHRHVHLENNLLFPLAENLFTHRIHLN
jgi:regulator of cell morphogenesis and NO signaling